MENPGRLRQKRRAWDRVRVSQAHQALSLVQDSLAWQPNPSNPHQPYAPTPPHPSILAYAPLGTGSSPLPPAQASLLWYD